MAAMDGSLSDLLLQGGRFEAIFGAQGVEMVADNAVGTKILRLRCGYHVADGKIVREEIF